MEKTELTLAGGRLPVRLGIPFEEALREAGKWDWDVYILYFNCVGNILEELRVNPKQIRAVADQYFKEQEKKKTKT